MAVTIGSNVASLKAQRQLFQSSGTLSSIFERLSSGQRINRASDDAAGLAIASSLRANQRVYAQGMRNLNDGISALNIADGAIGQLSSIVIRIQELATQSANGSLSHEQRASLDVEAQALSDEFLRITRTANFNGLSFFDGTLGNGLRLQGGYGEAGSILSSIGGALGTGIFSTSFTGTTATNGITTEDINGDGNLDLLTISDRGYTVSLGNGDGTFQVGDEVLNGDFSVLESIKLRDLNGDGVLDLIAGDSGNGQVFTLLGNGDGTFAEPLSFSASASVEDLQLGDLNNDGILDIVTANDSGGISVLLGNGDGTMQAALSFDSIGGGAAVHSVQIADFNGDGRLDVASAGDSSSRGVYIQLGNGDGNFSSSASFAANQTADLTVGDFNGDGIIDIAAAGSIGNQGAILLGNGDGTFISNPTILPIATNGRIEAADFNGDGFSDLIQSNGTNVSVLLGAGDGTFSLASTSTIPGAGFTTGDFNGDGVLDFSTIESLGGSRFDVYTGQTESGISAIIEFSLATQADALQALAPLSRKLESLSTQRGVIGAFQSRITSAVKALTGINENFAAAESRILDADIALESAQLTRLQILQQAGAAVLSQANQQPALAIQLLRGN